MSAQSSTGVLKCTASAVAWLVLTTTEAPTDIQRVKHAGTGSGALDGVPFSASDFVIAALRDTDDRRSLGRG